MRSLLSSLSRAGRGLAICGIALQGISPAAAESLPSNVPSKALPSPSLLVGRTSHQLKITSPTFEALPQAEPPPAQPYAAPNNPPAPPTPTPDASTVTTPLTKLVLPLPVENTQAAAAAPQPQLAVAGDTTQPVTKVYESPPLQIKREVIHLEAPPSARVLATSASLLNNLAPAAGEPAPDAPGNGTLTPLITLTETPVIGTMPAAPPAQALIEQKPVVPPPAASAPSSNPAQDIADLDTLIDDARDAEGKPRLPPLEIKAAPTKKEAKAEKKAKKAVAQEVVATPVITPVTATPVAEEGSLSESEAIARKIGSGLGHKKNTSGKTLDIKRAKDTEYLSKSDDKEKPDGKETGNISVKQHEAMGIKIEVKTPPVNNNYELEKAYNAIISGQSDVAIQIYKNILSNEPNNTQALFSLATLYHRAGQLNIARSLYGKLLAIDPDHRDALNNFLVLLADESPQEALIQMEALRERNPEFSPIPAQIAIIYQKLGDTEKAAEQMAFAVDLAPENLTYRYNYAILLDKLNNPEEAAKLYRMLIEAHLRGEIIPGNPQKIQERLTFISSNRP